MSFEMNNLTKGLVSVVTPVYNNMAYLPEMLESVLGQTYDKIQMILVDDGSSDRTFETAEAFKEKFEKRGYEFKIISLPHKNASAAVSAGLKYVEGEFIIWPDSDDLLLPESVEKRVRFLQSEPNFDAVRSLPEYFNAETGEPASPRERIGDSWDTKLFWDILEGRSFVSCGCYMLKTELLFELYPERSIPVYDVGQNFQMLLPYMYFHECATLPQVLYRVRVHDDSHSVRKLDLWGEIYSARSFSLMLNDIAKICGIKDKTEMKRIRKWQKHRMRRAFRNLPFIKQLLKIKYSLG